GALPQVTVLVDLCPGRARIVGAEHPAVRGLDNRPDAVGVGRRHRHADDAHGAGRETFGPGDLLPGVAAVGALPQPRALAAALQAVGRPPHLPGAGVEHARVAGVEHQVNGPGLLAGEQDALPALAPVGAAEHPALLTGAVQPAQRGGVDQVRVPGVDAHARDVVGVAQPDVLPGLAGVERLP